MDGSYFNRHEAEAMPNQHPNYVDSRVGASRKQFFSLYQELLYQTWSEQQHQESQEKQQWQVEWIFLLWLPIQGLATLDMMGSGGIGVLLEHVKLSSSVVHNTIL